MRKGSQRCPHRTRDLPHHRSSRQVLIFLDAQSRDAWKEASGALGSETITRNAPKIGRNDPCSCGSGRKYKKCCLS
jgi:SEC-C motif domain protein